MGRDGLLRLGIGFVLVGACALPACGGSRSRTVKEPQAPRPPEEATAKGSGKACERTAPGVGAKRLGAGRSGGTVALATLGGRAIAYVADADEPSLHTIDIDASREIATTPLHGAAEQVIVLGDGRVVATLRHEGAVEILEPKERAESPLASRCLVDVPDEPIALATTPSDDLVLVTSGWGHTLTGLDPATMATKLSADLPREPRSIVVSDDGKRAFVSHVVGAKMSVVDLGEPAPPRSIDLRLKQVVGSSNDKNRATGRLGCQGFALAKSITIDPEKPEPAPLSETPTVTVTPGPKPPPGPSPAPHPTPAPLPPRTLPSRIFAPFVAVDPGEVTRRSSGYGQQKANLAAELSSVTVVDGNAERSLTRAVLALPRVEPRSSSEPDCLLPRAATVSGTSLLVACQGIDSLLELDARALDPARAEIRRFPVGAGPTGVAALPDGKRAVVMSQFDRMVTIVDRTTGIASTVRLASSGTSAMTTEARLGRVLFHKTQEPGISKDGRACASCHPEGREDALTWSTPEGPRQTMMLAGRLQRPAAYGWSGQSATVTDHVRTTMQRLEGKGITEEQLTALVAYVQTMPSPENGKSRANEARLALIERGRRIFHTPDAACATCHGESTGFTDGQKHDIGSRVVADLASDFETPSLRFLSGTAPYFHDGRFASIPQLLEGTDGSMGHTMHLPREDREALAAYLETL